MRHELEGEDDTPHEVSLLRAWIAFRIGNMEQKYFGGHSFGWVALGGIFDTIKDIEDEERTITRRYVDFCVSVQRTLRVRKLTYSCSA